MGWFDIIYRVEMQPLRRLLFFDAAECFVPPLRGSNLRPVGRGHFPILFLALPLPGRGLLFARAKRSKRSLRKLRFLRTFLNYGGYCFLRFHCSLSGLKQAAPMDRAKRLFEDVNADPTVLHAESPGAVPLERPPSRLYPFNRPAGGVG